MNDEVEPDFLSEEEWGWEEWGCAPGHPDLDPFLQQMGERIEEGDEPGFRRLLADHPKVIDEFPGAAGDFLFRAVERGWTGTVSALIEAGVAVDWANELGATSLMEAASRNHLPIARLLLEAGGDPNTLASEEGDRDYNDSISGWCALYFALAQGHQEMVALLEPLTHPAIRELGHQAAERHFAWIAAQPPPPPPEVQALFQGVYANDPAAIRAALTAGADINAPNGGGQTSLYVAAASDRLAALLVLLEAGAVVDAVTEEVNETPLWMASRMRRESVMAPLLRAGADPDRTDEFGWTCWMIGERTGGIDPLRRAWREVFGTDPPA